MTADSGEILVVEDEWIVACDIQHILKDAGHRVPHLASTAEEALRYAERDAPDVVVMDIMLRGAPDGIETARQLRARCRASVIFVTALVDEETLSRAALVDATGYLLKPVDERQLRTSVGIAVRQARRERARQGRATPKPSRPAGNEFTRTLTRVEELLDTVGQRSQTAGAEPVPCESVAGLTPRECEVLRHIIENRRVPSIARLMHLSQHTVRNHLKAVFRKVGVHSQIELIEWARGRLS